MDFVAQLKSSVDIVQVIQEYVPRLRRASANRYVGLCPFHNEKTPSFSVRTDHQYYYCFGCSAKGDVLKFVMEMERISFYEALKLLAERHGIPMPKRSEYSDPETKLRAALYQMHEMAQEAFRANLHGASGSGSARISGAARRGARRGGGIWPRLCRALRAQDWYACSSSKPSPARNWRNRASWPSATTAASTTASAIA